MKPLVCTAAFIGCSAVLLLALACVPAQANPLPQVGCGNEGEPECAAGEIPAPLNPLHCDTGLTAHTYFNRPDICGCTRRLLGICVAPISCDRCVNHTRRMGTIDAFKGSWVDWALRNQRELAQDEPLNWVMHLGTHNSFSTVADGHIDPIYGPNQVYSITDQLRSGARLLTLDQPRRSPPTTTAAVSPHVCSWCRSSAPTRIRAISCERTSAPTIADSSWAQHERARPTA